MVNRILTGLKDIDSVRGERLQCPGNSGIQMFGFYEYYSGLLMSDLLEFLEKTRLVPVVSLPSVEAAVVLAELLVRCDLPVVEVTFRTAHAAAGLAAIKNSFPQMQLLAGTVITAQQADAAIGAGAAAVVSPGFSPKLGAYCRAQNIPFFPGVCTPSEVQTAMEGGFSALKFFPAEKMGSLGMLELFKAIYPETRFMPTGGIKPENLAAYLALDNVLCCGGTWLCPEKLMAEGHWGEIERRVKAAVRLLTA